MDVQGGTYTGGLVGSNGLVIVACSVTGVVSGGGDVGGLVGDNFSGTVIASYSAASVADGGNTGGLVGDNFGGRIIASYSIGSVSDYDGVSVFVDVGGLVGSNFGPRDRPRQLLGYPDLRPVRERRWRGQDDERAAVANGLHGHLRELER